MKDTEAVAEGFYEIAFARDECQLNLYQGVEGVHLWLGLLLRHEQEIACGHTFELTLNVVELPNVVERVLSNLGLCCRPDVMEVPPEKYPTSGLTDLGAAIGACYIEHCEAGVRISLQDSSATPQMLAGMFTFPGR